MIMGNLFIFSFASGCVVCAVGRAHGGGRARAYFVMCISINPRSTSVRFDLKPFNQKHFYLYKSINKSKKKKSTISEHLRSIF
jgi:hypothetical protein